MTIGSALSPLSGAAVLYARTRSYRRTLEEMSRSSVPGLDAWTNAVGFAVSSLEDAVAEAARGHEMWLWIRDRVDANPVVVGRLLARLDPARARAPSSFWRYCGLATVAAVSLQCDRCGRVSYHANVVSITCARVAPDSMTPCGGSFHPASLSAPIRVAQRWVRFPANGSQPYDAEARTAAFLLGHDLIQRSARYSNSYRGELCRLHAKRPKWGDSHRFRAARRRVTKQFLADLWREWRTVRGLPAGPERRAHR